MAVFPDHWDPGPNITSYIEALVREEIMQMPIRNMQPQFTDPADSPLDAMSGGDPDALAVPGNVSWAPIIIVLANSQNTGRNCVQVYNDTHFEAKIPLQNLHVVTNIETIVKLRQFGSEGRDRMEIWRCDTFYELPRQRRDAIEVELMRLVDDDAEKGWLC